MKKLLAVLLCVCFVFSLTACGQTPEEIYESNKQAYTDFLADFNNESVLAQDVRIVADANGDKMLMASIKNNKAEAVSEIILSFAIWDSEGNPLIIKTAKNPANTYSEFQMDVTGVTVEAGALWSENKGLYLDSGCGEIAFQKAVVVSYKNADGTVYENPLYSAWKETYLGKTLEDYMR